MTSPYFYHTRAEVHSPYLYNQRLFIPSKDNKRAQEHKVSRSEFDSAFQHFLDGQSTFSLPESISSAINKENNTYLHGIT